MKTIRFLLVAVVTVLLCLPVSAQKKNSRTDIAEALKGYYVPASAEPVRPDGEGFIRRWLMLEPISKPNISITPFTIKFTRETLSEEYFPNGFPVLPKDGDKVKVRMAYQPPVDFTVNRRVIETAAPDTVKATLVWHALDSERFYVRLLRFAAGLNKDRYCVIYNYITVINCEEDIENVRLSVGSNKSSMWWLNGEELMIMPGDRYMVADNVVSKRFTLKKGKNIIRGASFTGTGMSEFCARIIDDSGNPVRNYTLTCE